MANTNFLPMPKVPVVDLKTGLPTIPWYQFWNQPNVQSLTITGTLGVTSGGTGLDSGIPGGVLSFVTPTKMVSSAELGQGRLVLGGGPSSPPSTPLDTGASQLVLHGNTGGSPTWGPVNLSTDVIGQIQVAQGGTGLNGGTVGSLLYFNTSSTMAALPVGTKNYVLVSNGVDPQWSINEPDLATVWCYT